LLPTDQTEAASAPFGMLREASRRIERERSALLVVDIQSRLAPHVQDHEALIARTCSLIQAATRFRIPRLATEHCGKQIGPLVERVRSQLAPTDIFAKTRFGVADHPEFRAMLARTSRTQVVVAGMEAHVCVMQSSLGLAAAGYEVFVVADAVGSRGVRALDRQLALERMRAAGCMLVGTETVLFEWTGSGDDAAFRDVLALVKALP
jgi:nicotinamidase-related amidase